MYHIPADYEQINVGTSKYNPSTVHVKNNALSGFFRRYLFNRAMSVYKWTLPKEWAKNYFMETLYRYGFIGVAYTPEFGVIPQQCTLSGYNVFYQPKSIIIANPLIKDTLELDIDSKCVLIRMKNDYTSIIDIVNYYGDMLALCSESVNINLFNSHVSYAFGAKNKAQAEAFKKAFDKVGCGEPLVVTDSAMYNAEGKPLWSVFAQDVKQNYIAHDILIDMTKIRNQFDTEIGIPNTNTDKRERLTDDEVNANNVDTYCSASMWLENLQEGCEKVNAMFGKYLSSPLKVDWRFRPNNIVGGVAPDEEQY